MPRGKPKPKSPDDPVAIVRKRIADAERANAARIIERVGLTADSLELVASLVEAGTRKPDVLSTALRIGLVEMSIKSLSHPTPTRTVWRDAEAVNAQRPFVALMARGEGGIGPVDGFDTSTILDTMPAAPVEESGIDPVFIDDNDPRYIP